MSARNRLFSQRQGPLFHGVVPLGQGPGHVRVRHTLGSRDEPGDQLSDVPAPAPGRVGPAVDPTMENGSDISGAGQGLACDELWQHRFNVEAAGFGVAQSREQRAPCAALAATAASSSSESPERARRASQRVA